MYISQFTQIGYCIYIWLVVGMKSTTVTAASPPAPDAARNSFRSGSASNAPLDGSPVPASNFFLPEESLAGRANHFSAVGGREYNDRTDMSQG